MIKVARKRGELSKIIKYEIILAGEESLINKNEKDI